MICQLCNINKSTRGLNSCKCITLCDSCSIHAEQTCSNCGSQGVCFVRRLRKFSEDAKIGTHCLRCSRKDIIVSAEFSGSECNCRTMCKNCAMSMASGGSCLACGIQFSSIIRRPII